MEEQIKTLATTLNRIENCLSELKYDKALEHVAVLVTYITNTLVVPIYVKYYDSNPETKLKDLYNMLELLTDDNDPITKEINDNIMKQTVNQFSLSELLFINNLINLQCINVYTLPTEEEFEEALIYIGQYNDNDMVLSCRKMFILAVTLSEKLQALSSLRVKRKK